MAGNIVVQGKKYGKIPPNFTRHILPVGHVYDKLGGVPTSKMGKFKFSCITSIKSNRLG